MFPLDAVVENFQARPSTILVVDDEPSVLKLVVAVLRLADFSVLEAETAERALLICETETPPLDLLVTDMKLGTLTGVELGARIRLRHPSLPVLYMTGFTDDQPEIFREVAAGRGEYLAKPFSPSTLLGRVQALLKRP